MDDNYYIDLESISLSDYEKELQNTELLPSRKIIKEDIENRFRVLSQHGVNNLNDILTLLKTPPFVVYHKQFEAGIILSCFQTCN